MNSCRFKENEWLEIDQCLSRLDHCSTTVISIGAVIYFNGIDEILYKTSISLPPSLFLYTSFLRHTNSGGWAWLRLLFLFILTGGFVDGWVLGMGWDSRMKIDDGDDDGDGDEDSKSDRVVMITRTIMRISVFKSFLHRHRRHHHHQYRTSLTPYNSFPKTTQYKHLPR